MDYLCMQGGYSLQRTSENPQKAKFAEFLIGVIRNPAFAGL
jgi:hypothetical protein